MFIESIDQLRCTSPHEDTWLVASFTEREDRFVRAGTLGCHICLREYPIVQGVAYFGTTPGARAIGPAVAADPDVAMRAAALLGASERATLVLAGTWAPHAHAVTDLLPVSIFALNPSSTIEESAQVAIVEAADGIPLAPRSVAGIALDEHTAIPPLLDTMLRVLRAGGRLLAPVSVPVPSGITELARDDTHWVGETSHESVSDLIPLRRR